jgi:hypothetical protein
MSSTEKHDSKINDSNSNQAFFHEIRDVNLIYSLYGTK